MRALRRPLAALPVLALLLGLAACGDDGSGGSGGEAQDDTSSPTAESSDSASSPTGSTGTRCRYRADGSSADVTPPPEEAAYDGPVPVTIGTSAGDLEATLDAAAAPCTVGSFVSLAEQGYFDGTTCHRLTTEGIFVLQCGDPTGTGTGGPGYSFPDELSGQETYPAGTLAMANAGPDTNGSQFFIVYEDTPLPPSYTVFGEMSPEAVDTVAGVAEEGSDEANGPGDGAPNTPVDIESVAVG